MVVVVVVAVVVVVEVKLAVERLVAAVAMTLLQLCTQPRRRDYPSE